jgi:hypothetical protein
VARSRSGTDTQLRPSLTSADAAFPLPSTRVAGSHPMRFARVAPMMQEV